MSTQKPNAGIAQSSLNEEFAARFRHEQSCRHRIQRSLVENQIDSMNTALQKILVDAKDASLSDAKRAALIDQCASGITGLSNDVRDASGNLPAHDQRIYSSVRLVIMFYPAKQR